MKNKIIISAISMMAVMPAFADIDANNNNPTCDSTTIGATSGDTALDAVWNIVNQTCNPGQYFDMTTATCVTCSANSYCPGGTYNVESQTNGSNSCPNDYALSASGADAQTDCYRTCTTNDVAHSTGVTGGYYYGENNQCGATSCETGWHVKQFNLLEEFAGVDTSNMSSGYLDYNGNFHKGEFSVATPRSQSDYGLTGTQMWAISWSDSNGFGALHGQAQCSTTPGSNGFAGGSWDNVTTLDSITDESGAVYCYCNITGYKPIGGEWQSLSSVWMFSSFRDNPNYCAGSCAYNCAGHAQLYSPFRTALFATVAPSLATCEANTINITWYNEGNVHDENTCTYAESVTLPETNPERTGYNFTGWTVRPASNE